MSKAWGDCPDCDRYTLHYIRTIKKFEDVTKPRMEYALANLWEGDPKRIPIRWIPGKRTKGRKMLRECRDCGKQWWEILETRTEDA